MAKPPRVEVSKQELDELFQALGIWVKIFDRRLSAESIPSKSAPSWRFDGGISEFIRHRNPLRLQVATTHRITTPDGGIPHWHAKDIHLSGVVIWAR